MIDFKQKDELLAGKEYFFHKCLIETSGAHIYWGKLSQSTWEIVTSTLHWFSLTLNDCLPYICVIMLMVIFMTSSEDWLLQFILNGKWSTMCKELWVLRGPAAFVTVRGNHVLLGVKSVAHSEVCGVKRWPVPFRTGGNLAPLQLWHRDLTWPPTHFSYSSLHFNWMRGESKHGLPCQAGLDCNPSSSKEVCVRECACLCVCSYIYCFSSKLECFVTVSITQNYSSSVCM